MLIYSNDAKIPHTYIHRIDDTCIEFVAPTSDNKNQSAESRVGVWSCARAPPRPKKVSRAFLTEILYESKFDLAISTASGSEM